MSTTQATHATPLSYRSASAIPLSIVLVTVLGSLANAVIAAAALGLGLDDPAFQGLQPFAYVALTLIAAIAGAFGWHLVNRRAARPGNVFRWLVPSVLLASFVPDILVGAALSWAYAVALMLMHVATITIAVLIYRWRMPVRRG